MLLLSRSDELFLDRHDLSNSDFNSANFLSSSISNSLRSLTTSFVVALWWNGQNCSSSSNQGVCKDNAGNVIL